MCFSYDKIHELQQELDAEQARAAQKMRRCVADCNCRSAVRSDCNLTDQDQFAGLEVRENPRPYRYPAVDW